MTGQLLSTAGSQLTTVAYPLLALAVTDSPAKAGLVGFARLAPSPIFGLLAGVVADRWDRKLIMIVADGVRVAQQRQARGCSGRSRTTPTDSHSRSPAWPV